MIIRPIEVFEFAQNVEKDFLNREISQRGMTFKNVKDFIEHKKHEKRQFIDNICIPDTFWVYGYNDLELFAYRNTGLPFILKVCDNNHQPILFNKNLTFLSCEYYYDYDDSNVKSPCKCNLLVSLKESQDKYNRKLDFLFRFKDLSNFAKNGLSVIEKDDISNCDLHLRQRGDNSHGIFDIARNINPNSKIDFSTQVVLINEPLKDNESKKVSSAIELSKVTIHIFNKYIRFQEISHK